ncbi:MAG: 1-deoxy-D-xylulose-5-phosphate reductoisomerase [Lachnospiraceae bacterium]|nr:1-deoxy-D-xylulose-5-phosphate reductoisomerase [Lachnospiraceae bacterium]
MKKIAILGSTGSIGTQTLEIVRDNPDLKVTGLCAGKNVDLLEKQVREFMPELAVMGDEKCAEDLKHRISDLPVKVLSGMDGMIELATMQSSDMLLTAIVGMIGIRPTIAAINAGKDIALANKETLVCAGHIIIPLAKEKNVGIYPVDSEHSAIFQSMHGENKERINKILLTASGGPFRGMKRDELKDKTRFDALKHPNWNMGNKITIDSATLVNKGLEVMEAGWLFGVPREKIEVVIHPQSIIHSMVEYVDGGIMAQLGMPDMKLPIQYAIFYPDRRPLKGKKVDFFDLKSISFEEPDIETFSGLKMAYEAMDKGGSMPTVFNAANEKAVALFLNDRIRFLEIYDIIRDAMDAHSVISNPSVDDILQSEQEVYERIRAGWGDI